MAKQKVTEPNIKKVWQNRIVGYFEKPARDFNFNPKNWRTHGELQKNAISDVLSEIGWVTGVIENEVTGNLIDGLYNRLICFVCTAEWHLWQSVIRFSKSFPFSKSPLYLAISVL